MKNLSIIIPHYNTVVLLERLLRSIPSYDNIQAIVVDDRSDSDQYKQLTQLQSIYPFELYINEGIKGAGAARNVGLKYAKSDWLLFADSDDYFVDNFYDALNIYFESQNDVVFFLPTSVYIDTGEIADRHLSFEKVVVDYIQDKNRKNELNLRYMIPNPVCKMIKKKFIDQHRIKFDEIIASNDVMFSTKVGYYAQLIDADPKVIYCVVRSVGSLTTIKSLEVFRSRLGAMLSRYEYLKSRLARSELKQIETSVHGYLYQSKLYGIFEVIRTLKLFFIYKINPIPLKYLNPVLFASKIKILRKNDNKINKYRGGK